jgi:hypothetical protein
MNLVDMVPSNDLASTAYCLANPGKEYLVYLPEGGQVTLDLSAVSGELKVEWFNPTTGEAKPSGVTTGGRRRDFTAPFSGDAVFYLSPAQKSPAKP